MRHWAIAVLAMATATWAAQAQAAPQILGLVATNAPLPVTCENDACTVELSAFCLQRDRHEPASGTPYRAYDAEHLVLEATGADGGVRRMAIGRIAEVESARGRFAVTLTLPRSVVDGLGSEPRLAVAPMAALVPEAVPGDPAPLTEEEIARAGGPLRHLAGSIAEGGTSDGNRARILTRVINAMPDEDELSAQQRTELWAHGLEAVGSNPDVLGVAPAAADFDNCRAAPSAGMSVKACLQLKHDSAVGEMNIDIWTVTGAGS